MLAVAGLLVVSNSFGQPIESANTARVGDNGPASSDRASAQTVPSSSSYGAAAVVNAASALLDQYRARALYTRFSAWSGQTLYRDAKPLELGYFGGNYRDIFAGSPAALESASTYRSLRLSGTAAYVVGLGLLVTDFVLVINRSDSVYTKDSGIRPLYWGLLIPGVLLSFSGGIAMVSANSYLSDAVDQYNSDLAQQLKRDLAHSSSRLTVFSVLGKF